MNPTIHPLARYLHAIPDFPKPGILFQDIFPLLKTHFRETIEAVSALFSDEEWAEIECIVGIESRGFIFASALAMMHDKGFVPVRKPGKLPNVAASQTYGLEYGTDELQIQQGEGQKVIILDDLIATGGSMGAAATLCEQAGYDVVGMACLIELTALNQFSFHDQKVRSVIQFTD